MTPRDAVAELRKSDHEVVLLTHVGATLGWDQETYMPDGAAEERAEQLATIEGLVHERRTAPRIGELLAAAGASEDQPEGASELGVLDAAFVREKWREYSKAVRLPNELVRRMAETASRGQHAWVAARRNDEFTTFQPWLEQLVSLNREMADHLGHDGERYDALLDQFEPYATTSEVARVFAQLRAGLVDLVQRIVEQPQVDDAVLTQPFAIDGQTEFSRQLMLALGYDLERGRLDISAHPFTTTLGGNDVRITTRYNETMLASSLFGTIHETGHALYELGVAEELRGTLLAEGTSLGIHESQSRMWENMIGRSRPFWEHWLPKLTALFPSQLDGVALDGFYRAINKVEPSFIRVEADEVTYSLHIILRFELEQDLIEGRLDPADAPAAWREKSRELLGIVPDTDATGVLQDVHWSMGAFGYFPTYALGNLYAAQFLSVMERDMPEMWEEVRRGDTAGILAWLRERIHRHGKARTAGELVQSIAGGPLDPEPYLAYLEAKYRDIYRL